jgi:hypothetical protein
MGEGSGVMGEDCLHDSRAVIVQRLWSGFLRCRGAIREQARVPSLASINHGKVRATVWYKLQAIKSSKRYPTSAWQLLVPARTIFSYFRQRSDRRCNLCEDIVRPRCHLSRKGRVGWPGEASVHFSRTIL